MKNGIIVAVCLLALAGMGYFYVSRNSPETVKKVEEAVKPKPSWQSQQKELLEKFLDAQTKGQDVSTMFCPGASAVSLYAVKTWTVVDDSNAKEDQSIYVLRIASSTKGGFAIEKLWMIGMVKIKDKDTYCITQLTER